MAAFASTMWICERESRGIISQQKTSEYMVEADTGSSVLAPVFNNCLGPGLQRHAVESSDGDGKST